MRPELAHQTSQVAPDEYADLRLSYTAGALSEDDLAATPGEQFRSWFEQVSGRPEVVEPNAMVLSTVAADGAPSSRTVLLKGVADDGFRFYTNLGSRKGLDLAGNPAAALLFGWHPVQRQVVVRGRVALLDRDEVAAYFVTRPYGSRIGAWASRQSAVVADRATVEAREAELVRRWPDTGSVDDVPLPEHWGGFRLAPTEVEFWQGRPSRLHDRLVFVARAGTGGLDTAADWRVERRWP